MGRERVAALYRKYGPVIYGRCRRLLRDDALAEDATQDVFVKVLRHIDSAPDDDAALRWIYRISTNHCLNLLRARRPDLALESADEPVAPSLEAAVADRDLVLRVLLEAPEAVRGAALLHYVDGLDQGRVAEALGVTRRTIINRLAAFAQHARRLLKLEPPKP